MSKKSDEAQRYRALRLIESLSGRDPPTIDRLLGSPHRDVRDAALRHPGLSREVWYSRLSRLDSMAAWDNPMLDLEMVTGKPFDYLQRVYRTASAARDSDARNFIDTPGMRTMLSWMLKWWNTRSLPELVRFSAQHVLWRSNHRHFFPCVDMLGMGELPEFPDPQMRENAAKALRIVQLKMTADNPAMDFLDTSYEAWKGYVPNSPWEHWLQALLMCVNPFRHASSDLPDKAMEVTAHLLAAGYNLTADTFRTRFPVPPANCQETLWPPPPPPGP